MIEIEPNEERIALFRPYLPVNRKIPHVLSNSAPAYYYRNFFIIINILLWKLYFSVRIYTKIPLYVQERTLMPAQQMPALQILEKQQKLSILIHRELVVKYLYDKNCFTFLLPHS